MMMIMDEQALSSRVGDVLIIMAGKKEEDRRR
jgi:hypothetical protein